jgi:hypothetical protein
MQRLPYKTRDLLWKAGHTVGYLIFLFLFINILNFIFA